VFLPLSSSPIAFLPPIFQLCDFTPTILKQRNRLPLPRYVMLTVLNVMWKDRITLVILPLIWVFLCNFTPNPDFSKCSWFCRKFWNIFQILLNFKWKYYLYWMVHIFLSGLYPLHDYFGPLFLSCSVNKNCCYSDHHMTDSVGRGLQLGVLVNKF
jgi:hypothetical protein